MTKLFISYRRIDQDITGRMHDHLVRAFGGKDNVFKDVDNIPSTVRQPSHGRCSRKLTQPNLIGCSLGHREIRDDVRGMN
jgi:hypothetical protein